MHTSKSTHAVVIGGSMAGLLATRVLSEHFDRVTVIERDKLPAGPEYRNGVPQSRHLHTLLAHGETLLEALFPGFGEELESYGVPCVQWGWDTRFVTKGRLLPRFDSGMVSHTATRTTLEWVVRQRVQGLTNVTILPEHDVECVMGGRDDQLPIGVVVRGRINRRERIIEADFVVDASGRGSKAPEWLSEMGYSQPQETVVNANLGYATCWYQLPEDATYDWKTIAVQSHPEQGNNRAGGAFIVEDNQLVVTVAGVNKDYPPTDEDGFMAFVQSLASPIIYETIKDLQPITSIYGYRRTANRIRHYEKLSKMPERFIVMGDAACAFNPIYGQGMTTAALEATALRQLLEQHDPFDPGFSMRFQEALAKAVKQPWLMATGDDLSYPETEGKRPNALERAAQHYVNAVFHAMYHDTDLAAAFLRVMNLKDPITALLHPRYWRTILRHGVFGSGSGHTAAETPSAQQYA